MHYTDAFNFVSSQLERHCELSNPVASATLRLALRNAGLDPRWVTWMQMQRTAEHVLASELAKRAVVDSTDICIGISQLLKNRLDAAENNGSPPEDFLRRTRPLRVESRHDQV